MAIVTRSSAPTLPCAHSRLAGFHSHCSRSIAIKAFDSNHLYLGAKFAGIPSVPVLNACGQYCDVVSFDYYIATPKLSDIEIIYNNTNKPVLIAEYAFRGNVCALSIFCFFGFLLCQI